MENNQPRTTQEDTTPTQGPSCAVCNKGPPEVTLKHCAKCQSSSIRYCSRDCQKADWKTHKKICGKQGATDPDPAGSAADGPPSPSKGLEKAVDKPFTRLDSGTWLYDRPEKDVYRLLIDTYRMRMEDNYVHGHENTPGSVYTGASDGLSGFRRFLQLASARPGLLPAWWNPEKKIACEKLGMDPDEWCNLRYCVEKHDVVEHYGDSLFPMQLRMFGEAVYQCGPGGQEGAAVLKQMVTYERQGGFMTALSIGALT